MVWPLRARSTSRCPGDKREAFAFSTSASSSRARAESRVREQSLAVIRAGRAMPLVLLGQFKSAPFF